MSTIFVLKGVRNGKSDVICENSDLNLVENAAATLIHAIQYGETKQMSLYIERRNNNHVISVRKVPYSV